MSSNLITRSIFGLAQGRPQLKPTVETVFCWSKFVEESQVEDWEERFSLEEIPYVLEKSADRRRWKISVHSTDPAETAELHARHGGSVSELPPESWQPKAPPRPRPPLRIRDHLLVVGSDDEATLAEVGREHPDRIVLGFPPQLAFGTGEHATTANCLRFVVDFAKRRRGEPWRMLDLGSGSGILAVAAAKLGAVDVVAVENDPLALRCARENAVRHGVADRIEFLGDDAVDLLSTPPPAGWDLVAANLFSDLLETLFPRFPACLNRRGEVVVSGFLATQGETVSRAARTAGLPFAELRRRGKWMAGRCLA